MSITGAADGPPFRLGVAIADIVTGHVRGAGHHGRAARTRAHRPRAARSTSACSTRWRRCSPIRPASTSRPAPRRPRLGNRHPTIVPYETFAAADGDFVLASATTSSGGASARSPDSTPRRARSPPTGSASTDYDALKPIARRRARERGTRADWIDAPDRPPACRAARCAICTRCSPTRRSAARDMVASSSTRRPGRSRVLGTPLKFSDTPGVGADAAAAARRAHRGRARHGPGSRRRRRRRPSRAEV